MPDLKYSPCFQCRDPDNKEWGNITTLLYARATEKLCELHDGIAEAKIKDHKETKVYELKTPPSFLPPIPMKSFKNFQDREPNDGSLIE